MKAKTNIMKTIGAAFLAASLTAGCSHKPTYIAPKFNVESAPKIMRVDSEMDLRDMMRVLGGSYSRLECEHDVDGDGIGDVAFTGPSDEAFTVFYVVHSREMIPYVQKRKNYANKLSKFEKRGVRSVNELSRVLDYPVIFHRHVQYAYP